MQEQILVQGLGETSENTAVNSHYEWIMQWVQDQSSLCSMQQLWSEGVLPEFYRMMPLLKLSM